MWIASFDIGIKNFAFMVMDWKGNDVFEIVDVQNIDITTTKKIEKDIAKHVIEVLDAYQSIWEQCDYFIIEQQMQFRHATNIKALKISQFVLCYFYIYCKDKTIVEYPAYHKTQVLGAPPYLKKYDRKKWTVDYFRRFLKERNQEYILNDFKKLDDISDNFCLILAYVKQNHL